MSVTNDFVPFCPTDTGTNLLEQSAYLASPDLPIGNQPGVASSQLNNKALRQGTAIASQLAQFVANQTQTNVNDNGVSTQFLAQIQATLQPFAPNMTSLLSGSGTFNQTFYFMIASGNATAGATYTNNSITYTVITTISAGTLLRSTGGGFPTTSGTLTKASGTGDSTIAFYAYRSALFIRVKMVGGGGGGGSSAGGGTGGGTGGTTTFGSSFLTTTGGVGGVGGSPGAGGAATIGSGPVGIALSGSGGQAASYTGTGGAYAAGTLGGTSPFGGSGYGGIPGGGMAVAAAANSGSGGGGGATTLSSVFAGASGGAGGFIDCIINAPSGTYSYVIGAAGTAGTAGAGAAGSAGGSGGIWVEENFQ
jgi:hypothetical protein